MGGGSHSKYDQTFDSKEWQELGHPKDNDWQCMIVRNRKTSQLLDRYQVQCSNQKQYDKYMVSVYFRRNQDNIVRIIHYQPKIIKQFCGSSYILYVYLQHCKSRFSQFQDIPSPDYLYCALAMLNGFEKLFKKIGRFEIQPHQVMIDQMGKIRVWLNSDFSSNQAQDIKSIDPPTSIKNQQYLMVNDILNLIFQSLDQSDQLYEIKFKNFYQQKKIIYNDKIGFIQSKNIIYDFSKINKIQIPNIFTQVFNIYQQEKLQQIKNQNYINNQNNQNNQFYSNNKNNKIINCNDNGKGGNIFVNNNPENVGGLTINYPNQVNSASFIRGTSLPIISRPGITNTLPGTQIYINNRNTIPTTQTYSTSSYSGFRVPTPLSPLQILTPPSPTQNITHPPLTNIIFQNPTHSYIPKSQNITINPRQPLQSIQHPSSINQSLIKPIQTYPIQSSSSFNQVKTILHSSYPLSPLNQIHQGIRKTQSLQWNIQQQNKKNKIKKKIQLGKQQLQIQQKFILSDNKDNNHHNFNDQNINQANVIRQLSQLHKIQQIEKSKRSADKSSQENQDQHHKQQQQGFNREQQQDNLFQDHVGVSTNHFHPKQKIYQSIGNSIRGNNTFFQRQQKVIFNSVHHPQTQLIQQSFSPIQSKQSPRPLPSQYYNGFSPQLTRQTPSPPFQIQTNINNNVQVVAGNLTQSTLKKQVYYTVSDQIQLDPEIVNDLSLYVHS